MTSIEEDNTTHLLRFKNATPHPSYIAGMIDGDGCIFIRKIIHGYQSGITITQCRTNILQVIRYHFGGSITTSAKRNNRLEDVMTEDQVFHKHNQRNEYNLMLRSNEYKLLLDYIRFNIIIKSPQLECLYEFYKLVDIPNVIEYKELLHKNCSEQNKNKIMDETLLSRMNIEYIQGLFDAEGCCFIKRNTCDFKISIAQKKYPAILETIVEFLGYGKVYGKDLIIYKKSNCLKFIALIKNGLIVKYNQAIAFEKYLLSDDMTVKEEMYKICNEEKHKIEHFTKVNCHDAGKEGYNKTMQLRELKRQVCGQIHIKQVYKEKSEKMMGKGNHNFGTHMSVDTKKKLSTSIRDAKNGVSDESILKVRDLIQQGKKNTEIAEILKLAKHTVTRIKNGLTVCRNEMKEEKKVHLTQEEQNIKRRKIRLDELFIVIDKLISDIKPMIILETLVQLRIKEKKDNNLTNNNLTIDIIKNIKRNILEGKLPFYKCEVCLEKYHHYQLEVSKFCSKHAKNNEEKE